MEKERHLATILVALDDSTDGVAALEAATSLAVAARAELRGLFIEDDLLYRVAGLPCTLETFVHSAQSRPMSVADLGRRLAVSAELARRELERAANRANVHWSFQVVRGSVVPMTMEHFELADVVFIGRHGIVPPTKRLPRSRSSPPVNLLAIFDGGAASVRMLRRAAALALEMRAVLEIYLVAREDLSPSQQMSDAVSEVANYPVRSHVHANRLRDMDELLATTRMWRPRLIFFGADNRLLDQATLERLVAELDCPVAIGK